MKCQNCGKELIPNAKFCDDCGAPVQGQTSGNQSVSPVQYQPNQVQQIENKKKPIYKKWWFWVIIAVTLIVIYAIGMANKGDSGNNNNNVTTSVEETTVVVDETTAEPTTEKPTEPPTTAKPTEDPAKVESEFKDSCETIDFETLSRNPDKYKGNNYKFTGEVIQVQESSWGDTVDLRINITKEEFEYIDDVMWTDTIYATVEIPEGEDKILEDDILTFWGTCEGDYTYDSVLGNSITLPKISIKYYELSE